MNVDMVAFEIGGQEKLDLRWQGEGMLEPFRSFFLLAEHRKPLLPQQTPKRPEAVGRSQLFPSLDRSGSTRLPELPHRASFPATQVLEERQELFLLVGAQLVTVHDTDEEFGILVIPFADDPGRLQSQAP